MKIWMVIKFLGVCQCDIPLARKSGPSALCAGMSVAEILVVTGDKRIFQMEPDGTPRDDYVFPMFKHEPNRRAFPSANRFVAKIDTTEFIAVFRFNSMNK